ncbi:PNPOx family protein [Chitinophaga pinensis]|uniref:Pyridoxamine 5'-phosphate oxidase-related FMN-binding n=1 Tax=Chitinophaga pinensis (strain ATCC 43595 / DSM 2588 / LMG 13176 / NBRC 15968 / NCIMB 11800 / UQM 2034) TaxID=485918 RepID=A0A979GR50_CHIPD|nr:pyridoxamine 5'-phosphate oxidase family protein [Chitinophaga pinensis]ACU62062.1 pyridoxamine 5'-phosphate oxidase-related FMN- binding [Chitinophaga pinensis DSM 2588]
MTDVFHQGERTVQTWAGETAIAEGNSRMIAHSIAKGAISFVEKQPMAIVGSSNGEQELWASLLIGSVGFVKVPDPDTIIFDTQRLISNPADIFYSNITHNSQIGGLFIELDSRKRLRVNGTCRVENSKIECTVHQAFPNCPRYIQRRVMELPEYFERTPSRSTEGTVLTASFINWIQGADTLFVASAGPDGHLDASHRGGNPGFVEITADGALKIPDYPGNSLFSTFGNLLQHPRAGLLFIDFENRQTLQLTGTTSLLFDQTAASDLLKTKGTGRYWFFHPTRWIHTVDHHRVGWNFLEYSRFNP